MIIDRIRRWLPQEGGLILTVGFVSRADTMQAIPDNDGNAPIDLDAVDPGVHLPVAPSGAVVVVARTATDLRRAASLSALLPRARHVVIAVSELTGQRPIGVPVMSPELRHLSGLRMRRGSDGDWAIDANFAKAVPAGDVLVAVVRGLGTHPPFPVQRVALAGPGAAHWRPGDPDAIMASVGGPLDEPQFIPPADLVLRMVDALPAQWSDARVTVIDRPRLGRLTWASLGRPGAVQEARELAPVIHSEDHVPPVDEYTVNPVGFVATGTDGVADVEQVGDGWMIRGGGLTPMALHPSGNVTDADVARLRMLRAVRIKFGRHTGPIAAIRAVAGLACAGIPLVTTEVPLWAAALGSEVIEVLTKTTADDLDDDLTRQVHSIRLRRAALRAHSSRARWRQLAAATGLAQPAPPKVSVLLCTMRPEYVGFALAQITRQRRVDLEVILVLHRVPRDLPAVRRAVAAFDRPITVVAVDDDVPLGSALNRGAAVASGQLLAKWDDDDWYGPEHLADLALALDYSGAELVGCSHHLTYLQQIDLTVCHPRTGSEQYNQHLAGCTLLIERRVLREVSGFRPVPRREDMSLQRAVIAAGGRTYRTHGLGYVVRRRETGHSWDVPVTHFMDNMTHQWRGFHPGPLIATDSAAATESSQRDLTNGREP